MKISVLGSGCANGKTLYELTKKAVSQLGLKEKLEYITDISKIIEMRVMQSPVLAVNRKPVMVAFTSNLQNIKEIIGEEIKKKGGERR